ncbi:lactonase family protein [Pengzhenrongella sicca]|uniref:Lactonase family protein n=1 Tax=Pengzhenrongella sicca TaxID=2819238 RepID=A0A8A4ZJW9_9MICO|nr:lactonase family protein [Pengzhenrongella sicca]
MTRLWIGTYPAAGAGTPAGLGEGIWSVELDPATGALGGAHLAAATPAPSFLAVHPAGRVVYAAGETASGTVTSFAAGPRGELGALAVVSSGGADPCHLLLAPDAQTLYVANYSSGTLGVLPLDADGAFTRDVLTAGGPVQVFAHAGSGPDAARQDGPHAHFVALAPGSAHLLVVDLGTDELRRFRIETGGLLTADGVAATLPPGTGPRHLAAGPGGLLYVLGELDVSVRVLRWDAATATAAPVQALEATAAPLRSGRHVYPAHVVLDGDRLLVSVRGADVVATFAVDAATGGLAPAGQADSGGSWPRHFARVDGWTVVANQLTHTLTALGPTTPTASLALPSPACVVPAR